MSSLLDVLHKRPPRSQMTAAVPAAAVEVPQPENPLAELRLAPDSEFAAGTATVQRAALPVHGEVTLEMPQPGIPGDSLQTRRWADPGSAVHPATPAPDGATAAKKFAPGRLPLFALVALLVVAGTGFIAWQFKGSSGESFLAAPGDMPAAAAPVEVSAGRIATPEQPVVQVKTKSRRPKPAVTDEESAEATAPGGDELAWYDQPALPAVAGESAPAIQITRGSTRNPLFEKLQEAYAGLQSGDAARAESLYREVLAVDAMSVDALLGLASLAARGGRTEEARDLYRTVQRLDPKNGTAVAALSALPTLPGGPAQPNSESQLKSMLREQPASAALHFALGLRYVADQRWPDAQSAFFEAVRHEPTNPDYAFNLAISLDRLGQTQPAASYYQRAIELAAGSQQFDIGTARARLATLRGSGG